MPNNITTDNLHNLDELHLRDSPQSNSKFLVRTNGTDESMLYTRLYTQTVSIMKTDDNFGWNASKIDDVPITSDGYQDGSVIMYKHQEGAFTPVLLQPNDIDWSSFDENDFVKVNSNGELMPSTISVTDLTPTSTSNADKFLQVNEDGTKIIESDFDFDSLLHYPDVSETNANLVDSGLFVAGYSTTNRPSTGEQGYLISSRLRTDPSQTNPQVAQIFISTDSDDTKVRRNSGDLGVNDFSDWYTLYHDSNHPISNSITSSSEVDIASSKAVKNVNDKIDLLDSEYNPDDVLSKLITVDGSGSKLDADKLDGYHFSDLEDRYVNVTGDTIDGLLTIDNGNKIRVKRGTSNMDMYSENSRAVINTNNAISVLNGSNSQRVNMGGLLVSNSYSQESLVPANGIYSRGLVKSGTGYSVGGTDVIDSDGNMSWNRLKNIPSNVRNLGTASQRDVGTEPDQVPLNSTLANLLLPVGAVLPFAGDAAPTGWLVCDGSSISRTDYVDLYAYIGTKYGAGNGSTTFNIPDMRDEFIRGASGTRPVGNQESDSFKSHDHTGSTSNSGEHTHSGSTSSAGAHTHKYQRHLASRYGVGIDGEWGQNKYPEYDTSSAGNHTHKMNLNDAGNHSHNVYINNRGGSETRPRNIALLYCIKY